LRNGSGNPSSGTYWKKSRITRSMQHAALPPQLAPQIQIA
jgi:hypothetical protein